MVAAFISIGLFSWRWKPRPRSVGSKGCKDLDGYAYFSSKKNAKLKIPFLFWRKRIGLLINISLLQYVNSVWNQWKRPFGRFKKPVRCVRIGPFAQNIVQAVHNFLCTTNITYSYNTLFLCIAMGLWGRKGTAKSYLRRPNAVLGSSQIRLWPFASVKGWP